MNQLAHFSDQGAELNRHISEVRVAEEPEIVTELFELDCRAQAMPSSHLLPVATEDEFLRLLTEHEESQTFALRQTETARLMGYVCIGEPIGNNFGVLRSVYGIETMREVVSMVVDPEFWQQGCGRRLLSHAEQTVRDMGIRFMALFVGAKNESAFTLYTSCGFRIFDTCRYDYPFGREAGPRIPLVRNLWDLPALGACRSDPEQNKSETT